MVTNQAAMDGARFLRGSMFGTCAFLLATLITNETIQNYCLRQILRYRSLASDRAMHPAAELIINQKHFITRLINC